MQRRIFSCLTRLLEGTHGALHILESCADLQPSRGSWINDLFHGYQVILFLPVEGNIIFSTSQYLFQECLKQCIFHAGTKGGRASFFLPQCQKRAVTWMQKGSRQLGLLRK